jgi:hypothetical protein
LEEITKDQTLEDKADLEVVENKGLGEMGNAIYLLDIEEVHINHNMAEQGIIMEKIVVKTKVKLFRGTVRFDFIQRCLVAKVNRVLEVKITEENVLALHVNVLAFHVKIIPSGFGYMDMKNLWRE